MLRQVGLLTSGAQPWNSCICDGSGPFFAYCSTLAIYIYEQNVGTGKYKLHSIMCEHKKTITALAWNKANTDVIASTGVDKCIIVWSVHQQAVMARVESLKCSPVSLQWYPGDTNTVSFMNEHGPLYLWNFRDQSDVTTYKDTHGFYGSVTTFKWNVKQIGKVCFGHANGSLSFISPNKKSVKEVLATHEGDIVTDIEWDPLSTDYVLVSTKESGIRLVDSESQNVIMNYKLPSVNISIRKFSWVPSAPGLFVSGDGNSGVLRVWTVAKHSPIVSLKIKETGLHSICVLNAANKSKTKVKVKAAVSSTSQSSSSVENVSSDFSIPAASIVAVFNDGGVGVYDLKQRQWQFLRELGHIETIFDCQFHPDEPNILATASFDGTIKIWDTNTLKNLHVSPGNSSIVYSISWSPGEINCICAATSKQGVIVWDVGKQRITRKFKEHGENSVYSCVWNCLEPRYIASGGADNKCIVRMIDESFIKEFLHPAAVYGCDWSLKNKELLLTACEDGIIRIFYLLGHDEPLKTFRGHTAKVFSVKWSLLEDGIFCSGSDDGTIRVWNYSEEGCIQCLEGHSGPVRGLLWNTELPNIIVSGSWDATIQIWDIRTGYCLGKTEDHAADVYGLASHRQRPFYFASTSRDSTVRLWSLGDLLQPIYAKLIVDNTISAFQPLASQTDLKKQAFVAAEPMSGCIQMLIKSKSEEPLTTRLQIYSHCFLADGSVANLWNLVHVIRDGKKAKLSSSYADGVLHASHLIAYKSAKAQELAMVRSDFSKGIASKKKVDKLWDIADMYLSLGDLERYCEILIELNRWEKALSVAPGVSLKYWQTLARRYHDHLSRSDDEETKLYCTATGDLEKLCEFYSTRQQYKDAVLAVQVALSEQHFMCNTHQNGQHLTSDDQQNATSSTTQKDGLPELQWNACVAEAQHYFQDGRPISAACCYLSLDNIQFACAMLFRGNEVELAYTLIKIFDLQNLPLKHKIIKAFARRCEKYNLWTLAVKVLEELERKEDLLEACSRFDGPSSQREQLLKNCGLPSLAECALVGVIASNILEALPYHLLVDTQHEYLQMCVDRLKNYVTTEDWNLAGTTSYLELLWNIRSDVIVKLSNKLRSEILALCGYLGALLAICRSYKSVVLPLLQNASACLREEKEADIGVTKQTIHEEAEAWIVHNAYRNRKKTFVQVPTQKQKQSYDSLLKKCDPLDDEEMYGEFCLSGQNLPKHTLSYKNYFTKLKISGTVFILEDGVSVLPLNTALMWADVNPYSPLSTGHRINPF